SLSLFSATPTADIYTLSLHDALPIWYGHGSRCIRRRRLHVFRTLGLALRLRLSHQCGIVALDRTPLQEVDGLLELIVFRAAELEHTGKVDRLVFLFRKRGFVEVTVDQVTLEIRLAPQSEEITLSRVVAGDVGRDPSHLNGLAARRVVARGRQLDSGVLA